MTTYKNQAKSLINNGFEIVPINKGKKAPLIMNWQNKTFSPDEVTAGVGVKCGVGDNPICAVDIDVKDAELSKRIADAVSDDVGYTVERVGNAPKTLLVFRAIDAGWAKVSSRKFGEQKHQVEILGAGQQFVAYAFHPDTKQPYEWVDFFGGLEQVKAEDLQAITYEQVQRIIQIAEQIMLDAGLEPASSVIGKPISDSLSKKDNDDFTADLPIEVSSDELKVYLENLDPSDYDLWIKVGQALHHQFGGDVEGLNIWDYWSSKANNYNGYDDLEHKWSGFGKGGSSVTARTIIKLGKDANTKAEHEIKRAVIAEYREKIENAEDIIEIENIAKDIAKELVADDLATIDAVQSAIKAKWKEITGKAIGQKTANRLLNVPKEYGIEDIIKVRSFTEDGNAHRMLKDNDGKLMFIAETETWYLWANNHWRKSSSIEIEQLAHETIENLVRDYMELSSGIMGEDMEFLKKSFEAKMTANMVKIAKSHKSVLTRFSELDNNNLLLGVGNGAVDLSNGKLIKADPLDRITIVSPVDYTPQCICPVWFQTLKEIFNDDLALIHYVQKLIGYAVLGNPIESLFVILYGDGSNGKSTFINTIRDVLGNHAKVANSETFLGNATSNGGGPREDILRLMGSRVVTVTEPDEGGVLREGLIKAMTGGEALPARAAYGRTTVEVKPTWTAFMPTNHKPIIKGTDHGIWRRLVLIPFTVNFDNHPTLKKDPERMAKLTAEYEGILAWIVKGAAMYLEDGLQAPKVIEDARNEYKEDMDLLADWIAECCAVGHGEIATNRELWASWEAYARANGEVKYISSSRALAKRLSIKFDAVKNIGKDYLRGFKGISVKNADGFEDESENN